MSTFKRRILSTEITGQVAGCLQLQLVQLVDLALQLKQSHWCVVGKDFRAVHLQLDEIIIDIREGSDAVAERLSTLGIAPDGRSKTVATLSKLGEMSNKFVSAPATITTVADQLQTTIDCLRDAIEKLGELDPISEDLLIGLSASLEKHLWMVQSQEL